MLILYSLRVVKIIEDKQIVMSQSAVLNKKSNYRYLERTLCTLHVHTHQMSHSYIHISIDYT